MNCCRFPVEIPAEQDGCPDEEFCRDGNGNGCSNKQCDGDDDCGVFLVCRDGSCTPPSLSPLLAPVEGEPLSRLISWDVASVPVGAYVRLTCSANDGFKIIVNTDQGVSSYKIDFNSNNILSDFLDNMEKFAKGDYICEAATCIDEDCGEPEVADIQCGFNNLASFSKAEIEQVTGNPLNDKWFKIGDSKNIGILAEIRQRTGIFGTDQTYADDNPSVDLYATVFEWTTDIATNNNNVEPDYSNGDFAAGDTIIGIGWVGNEVTINSETKQWVSGNNNLYFKLAPSSGNCWYPATDVSSGTLPNGEGSFDCNGAGQSFVDGQIQIQSLNGVIQPVSTKGADFTVQPGNIVFKQYSTGDYNQQVEFLVKVASLDTSPNPPGVPTSFNALLANGWKFVTNSDTFRFSDTANPANNKISADLIAFSLPSVCKGQLT